jgi:hypothetical protein
MTIDTPTVGSCQHFAPSEMLFDALANPLADGVAAMADRATIDGTAVLATEDLSSFA